MKDDEIESQRKRFEEQVVMLSSEIERLRSHLKHTEEEAEGFRSYEQKAAMLTVEIDRLR
jgi:ribosomal protein S15P/S13E